MSDLDDLYQELILDHYRTPRNQGALEPADGKAEGYNPLCGDKVSVTIKLDGEIVTDVKFEGAGCAISTASASIMSETVKGKTRQEVEQIFEKFHRLATGAAVELDEGPQLGKLEVFASVGNYPVRVKCATLAWHTLVAALANRDEVVTTE